MVLTGLPLLIASYVLQRFELTPHQFRIDAFPFDAWRWLNAIFGVTQDPINYPLNFLRDLFVLSMAAPLMGFALERRAWIGLAVVVIIALANLDGPVVLRDPMTILFYVGGMAATQDWNLRALDRFWPWCLGALLAYAIGFAIAGDEVNAIWFRLVAPFLWWPVGAAMLKSPLGDRLARWSGDSFAIFILHAPFIILWWTLYRYYAPGSPYSLIWLFGGMLTIALSVLTRRAMRASAPSLARLVFGGR